MHLIPIARRVLAATAALCLATPLAAQAIRGRLVEPGGTPLDRVHVVLVDNGGRPTDAVFTDSAGGFVLRAPRAGQYLLVFEGASESPVRVGPFELRAGETRVEHLVATDQSAAHGQIAI